MKMKHIFPTLLLALGLLAGCGDNNNGKLSTDLVNNPKSAEQPSGKEAVITFDKMEHEFGKILQGEVVTYSFHFTNTGNAPLLITNVNTSCGCTVGDFPHEPIKPGQDGFIKATYDSKGHHGFQSRVLTVSSNTNPSTTTLRFKADVMTPDEF